VPRGSQVVMMAISCRVQAADEHTDLREDHQRPDTAPPIATTARRRHGNSGTASATDTDADNRKTSLATAINKPVQTNKDDLLKS